jgi:hypothetical protein
MDNYIRLEAKGLKCLPFIFVHSDFKGQMFVGLASYMKKRPAVFCRPFRVF